MSKQDRRQFLKGVLSNLTLAAGTVILASAETPAVQADGNQPDNPGASPENVQGRADRLAAQAAAEEGEPVAAEFLNGSFRNRPLGSFHNTPISGFNNRPLGSFRNTPIGAFRNTPLSTFANAPNTFGNGGWVNGVGGGFRNGGWPNGVWGNFW